VSLGLDLGLGCLSLDYITAGVGVGVVECGLNMETERSASHAATDRIAGDESGDITAAVRRWLSVESHY